MGLNKICCIIEKLHFWYGLYWKCNVGVVHCVKIETEVKIYQGIDFSNKTLELTAFIS